MDLSVPGLRSSIFAILQIGLPMFLVATATVLIMEWDGHGIDALLGDDRPGGGDGRWLVPLFATTTRWEHYTMFSWPHVRDFLNQQLLVAPTVLPGLLMVGIAWTLGHRLPSAARHPPPATRNFLLCAAGFYLLLTWVWNPDYGGQRDWDLFSLAAIPTAPLLVYGLPRLLPSRRLLRAGAVPLIVLQLLHTAAWIYQNRLPWEWPG